MISTPFARVPAGVLGSGNVVVRTYACAAVRSALPGVGVAGEGSGLPASVPATGMRLRAALVEAAGVPTAVAVGQHIDLIAQNDGTTLGIHSPGRPQS